MLRGGACGHSASDATTVPAGCGEASKPKGRNVTMNLRGRSFLKEIDFTAEEFTHLVDLAARLREEKRSGSEVHRLVGRNIALIFEKTSTRTRAAFEVGAHDQGAHVTYIGPTESQLGSKESMKDTARVLGRMFDGIEYRGFDQDTIEVLARHAGVPVWNGLTDQWHPTQMLADVLTMRDHSTRPFDEVSFCYVGDARNNTANSLLITGALLGGGAWDRRRAGGSVRRSRDGHDRHRGRGERSELPLHRRLALDG